MSKSEQLNDPKTLPKLISFVEVQTCTSSKLVPSNHSVQQTPLATAMINPQQYFMPQQFPQQQFQQINPSISWNNGTTQGNQQPQGNQQNTYQPRTNL